MLENKLKKESEIVTDESLSMLRDFEDIDYVINDILPDIQLPDNELIVL